MIKESQRQSQVGYKKKLRMFWNRPLFSWNSVFVRKANVYLSEKQGKQCCKHKVIIKLVQKVKTKRISHGPLNLCENSCAFVSVVVVFSRRILNYFWSFIQEVLLPFLIKLWQENIGLKGPHSHTAASANIILDWGTCMIGQI